jgi:hypothetical protein
MIEISEADIRQRIERDNPWWSDPGFVIREGGLPRRVYFAPFKTLALNPGSNALPSCWDRAVLAKPLCCAS